MLQKLVLNIKTWLRIKYINSKYKTGYLNSNVPKSFLSVEGLQINKNISFNWDMYIGKYCYIGSNTRIYNCSGIGNYCSISFDVKIGVINHALNHISTNPIFYNKKKGWISRTTYDEQIRKPAIIGHDVLISCNVVILEGVTIGTGAVIGAGSVVTKDIPPYAIAAGVPARIIKYRFDESLRNKLLLSKWWDLPKEELIKYSEQFNNPDVFVENIVK